ncbi:MAG: deoxyribonuclease IV [Acidobacteria bacterium]|nr:deoxyribonuclease IV [Acidobacteriota bacterium]
MRPPLIGAHMSIAGGIHKAFERGESVGCRTLQVFLKNSNRWDSPPLTGEDRELFAAARARTGIGPVVAHDSYLINLASPDRALYEKSVRAFMEEMRRADFLGVPFLVLHPGAHLGKGERAGCARVAEALDRVLGEVGSPVVPLLENTAGQGSTLGRSFEELASILEGVGERERVGVCFDTAHAFAAGYDLRTENRYDAVMREFDRLIGVGRIRVFHVNDSKKELGSRVDRHADIGKGFLGLDPFRFLLNDRRFLAVPKILETPKGPDLAEDRLNLATLESLCRTR